MFAVMFVATVIVSVLLAALMTYAAVRKLSHRKEILQTFTRVSLPEVMLPPAWLRSGLVGSDNCTLPGDSAPGHAR